MSELNLYQRLGGENAVNTLVENFYERMRDDYRVSRFFNDTEQNEQIQALNKLATAILKGNSKGDEFKTLVSHFFMSAFARFKDKERLPESGFAYLGLIIDQNHPSAKWLCDSHSHLLKFIPEDFHYDITLEHLSSSLQLLHLDAALMTEVLALAESGRNGVLGK